jgi:hypothetical protein
MRKRLVIAGTSREGLELLPLLEANPAVEVCALLAADPAKALAALRQVDPNSAARLEAVAARQARLERHEGAQTHELAAQRAAIARLQRALRASPRPRKTGKDAG